MVNMLWYTFLGTVLSLIVSLVCKVVERKYKNRTLYKVDFAMNAIAVILAFSGLWIIMRT